MRWCGKNPVPRNLVTSKQFEMLNFRVTVRCLPYMKGLDSFDLLPYMPPISYKDFPVQKDFLKDISIVCEGVFSCGSLR